MIFGRIRESLLPRKFPAIRYKKGLQSLHPQTCAAQRIFTSIPVTVSESKRSFSKLKLV